MTTTENKDSWKKEIDEHVKAREAKKAQHAYENAMTTEQLCNYLYDNLGVPSDSPAVMLDKQLFAVDRVFTVLLNEANLGKSRELYKEKIKLALDAQRLFRQGLSTKIRLEKTKQKQQDKEKQKYRGSE